MMTDDVPKKKEYLRDSREKLNKACKVNADSVTPDGQLSVFQLVNAFCESPHTSKPRTQTKKSTTTTFTFFCLQFKPHFLF